jgi:hypothetical protein
MGEIAEMVIVGILCERCGVLIDGETTGYPRQCDSCNQEKCIVKKGMG